MGLLVWVSPRATESDMMRFTAKVLALANRLATRSHEEIHRRQQDSEGLDLLARVGSRQEAGLDGIELWLGDVAWFQMSTTDAEVREMRRKVKSAGLAVSNVSTGLHWRCPLSAREPEIHPQGIRIVERQLETAQPLGTDAILLVPFQLNRAMNSAHLLPSIGWYLAYAD